MIGAQDRAEDRIEGIGLVRDELRRRGVTGLDDVAEEVCAALARLLAVHPFAFHVHLAEGPDAEGTVVASTGLRRECILWTHNIYLGLNRHPAVIERTIEAIRMFGTGSGTSPAVGGLTSVHESLAKRVAGLLGKDRAVLFPTGYTANLGALSALPDRGDLILLDRDCHASMFEGSRLSGAHWMAFRHNDLGDLESMLLKHGAAHPNVFVAVESAYSMSGDLCPLRDLVRLRQVAPFRLLVDEAHTFGLYGRDGRGYCDEQGVLDDVDFVTGTFSKATAGIGGFVAGRAGHCLVMETSARCFLAQACFPPAVAAAILAALEELIANPRHAAVLHENNRYMRESLEAAGFDLGSSASPVIPIRIPDVRSLYDLAARLADENIFAQPITEPGVARGESRLRFVVTARHTHAQIDRTVEALARLSRDVGLLDR